MYIKYLLVLCGLALSNLAFADCPSNLKAEKIAECITIEGAGENYQDWSKKFYASNSLPKTKPEISPITGKDIRTMKPAAGAK